ncbi:iron-sulfur assembly protein 1 [[Candida] jaroonii]|uniref:Iron-sulfur assembly protein 1 n=1 Tax=[Candida] jaroonii TaxID=467808 RepID=A0ACA9Y0W1_9ASCO|nr:iron-sulfur assembly protein 1 [[Candida] jaroonii]
MIRTRIINSGRLNLFRYISNETEAGKRFIQTIPITKEKPDFYQSLNLNNFKSKNNRDTTNSLSSSKWSSIKTEKEVPLRRSRTSRFKKLEEHKFENNEPKVNLQTTSNIKVKEDNVVEEKQSIASTTTESTIASEGTIEKPKKKRRTLRPRKAIITLSPTAVEHLKGLLEKPEGKYIRIGVQNRGCSGLTYHLEYVNECGKFDELVEQDGVKVFVDSKALFSIVGSEMDWLDDKLSSRFIFKNPNSKGTCGCGESFMV